MDLATTPEALGAVRISLGEERFLVGNSSSYPVATILVLLQNGAELEARDNDGHTLLRCAVIQRQKAVAKLLVRKGYERIAGPFLSSLAVERHDHETVEGLAREFASKVRVQGFSPAEVLSFLLKRKKSPYDAVSGVESWVAKAKDREVTWQEVEADDKCNMRTTGRSWIKSYY